jgi:hypothetical protein
MNPPASTSPRPVLPAPTSVEVLCKLDGIAFLIAFLYTGGFSRARAQARPTSPLLHPMRGSSEDLRWRLDPAAQPPAASVRWSRCGRSHSPGLGARRTIGLATLQSVRCGAAHPSAHLRVPSQERVSPIEPAGRLLGTAARAAVWCWPPRAAGFHRGRPSGRNRVGPLPSV